MSKAKRWTRIDLEEPIVQIAATRSRAIELAELSLPAGSKFFLIEYDDGAWAWVFLGTGAEEHVVA